WLRGHLPAGTPVPTNLQHLCYVRGNLRRNARSCSVKSSLETLPHSSKRALIINLKALFPNSPRQNTEADAARPGSSASASWRARSSLSAQTETAKQAH